MDRVDSDAGGAGGGGEQVAVPCKEALIEKKTVAKKTKSKDERLLVGTWGAALANKAYKRWGRCQKNSERYDDSERSASHECSSHCADGCKRLAGRRRPRSNFSLSLVYVSVVVVVVVFLIGAGPRQGPGLRREVDGSFVCY